MSKEYEQAIPRKNVHHQRIYEKIFKPISTWGT